MRTPVVDRQGVPLMPCNPAKARRLLAQGKARARWSKLGLFYIQLAWEQEADNQPLAVGVDPGATYEGYAVVGTKDTVLNLMAAAPTHVKEAIKVRRTMRRARRSRRCRRRPCRFQNRLAGHKRVPPSTRARWEAKARVVAHLRRILPLTVVVVEDVQAVTRRGQGGKWNASFSPVQVGKAHLYGLLRGMGLTLHTYTGWQTKELRERYGLKKTKSKARRSFASHAVDAWVLAASVTGAATPTCRRLWYLVTIRLHRRQLHRFQCVHGGIRKPYGGTRSLGYKRGTAGATSTLWPRIGRGVRPPEGDGQSPRLSHQQTADAGSKDHHLADAGMDTLSYLSRVRGKAQDRAEAGSRQRRYRRSSHR